MGVNCARNARKPSPFIASHPGLELPGGTGGEIRCVLDGGQEDAPAGLDFLNHRFPYLGAMQSSEGNFFDRWGVLGRG